jgi:hypothetical protein
VQPLRGYGIAQAVADLSGGEMLRQIQDNLDSSTPPRPATRSTLLLSRYIAYE